MLAYSQGVVTVFSCELIVQSTGMQRDYSRHLGILKCTGSSTIFYGQTSLKWYQKIVTLLQHSFGRQS